MKRMIIVTIPLFARISTAEPDGAQAEILFRQGKDLLAKGLVADACAAFDASQKLDPTTATLLNQANCREKNGQLATAWGLFLEAERKTRAGSDDTTAQMHKIAADHAAKLESRLSTLTITVPSDAKVGGLEIVRDGESIDPVMWNKTLPIDGGLYQITARAPGNADWSTAVTVANERDAKSIEIPRLKQAELGPLTQSVKPELQPDEVASTEPLSPGVESRSPRALSYLVGGGALVALGAALTIELVSESTYDHTKTEPDASRRLSLWNTANTERHVAQGLGIAGAATAGVATWLYIRARRERRVVVAPAANASTLGLSIVGGF